MGRWTIPAKGASTTLREGASGIAVWSLQHAINDVRSPDITLDGAFGPNTKEAVVAFQTAQHLTPDGIAGGATQRRLAEQILLIVSPEDSPITPPGLLSGFAEGESGWKLVATNYNVVGGIDCGLLQRRVYSPDYDDDAVIQRAFNTIYQADLLSKTLTSLRGIYIGRTGTNDHFHEMSPREKAWRLAALAHNYPAGAEHLSRTPINSLSSYWTSPQDWVLYDIREDGSKVARNWRFPDGQLVRTPLDWVHLYSGLLGAGVHGTRGSVTRYSSVWP